MFIQLNNFYQYLSNEKISFPSFQIAVPLRRKFYFPITMMRWVGMSDVLTAWDKGKTIVSMIRGDITKKEQLLSLLSRRKLGSGQTRCSHPPPAPCVASRRVHWDIRIQITVELTPIGCLKGRKWTHLSTSWTQQRFHPHSQLL